MLRTVYPNRASRQCGFAGSRSLKAVGAGLPYTPSFELAEWNPNSVRAGEIKLTVEEVSVQTVQMRIHGPVLLIGPASSDLLSSPGLGLKGLSVRRPPFNTLVLTHRDCRGPGSGISVLDERGITIISASLTPDVRGPDRPAAGRSGLEQNSMSPSVASFQLSWQGGRTKSPRG